MLRLGDDIRAHVKVQIGSGCESSFLYDNWHQLGPLYKVLNDRKISLTRVQKNDTIAEVVSRGYLVKGKKLTSSIEEVQRSLLVLCDGV
ncbi:hypothetical protein LIER_30977 [Lithospermum erythrorhizon]|uniref:Uncharacterized protein n=1 Tax=Lithospermum erythrorhizon TaxID=34254 RepID=A0AAV3RVD6_LITER